LRIKGSYVLQEEGSPERAKDSSASCVYESQCTILRLLKVQWGGSGRLIWKELIGAVLTTERVVGAEGREDAPLQI